VAGQPSGLSEARFKRPPRLKAPHELTQRQVKRHSEDFQGAEARFFLAGFQVGNEGPAQPRMNGKVRLAPALFLSELSHTFPESQADIFSCHALSMAVFFRLQVAYRIQLLSHRNLLLAAAMFGETSWRCR
jgi:hypothetical protein